MECTSQAKVAPTVLHRQWVPCRHERDEPAPTAEHPGEFGQHCGQRSEDLESHRTDDDVDRPVCERQTARIAKDDLLWLG